MTKIIMAHDYSQFPEDPRDAVDVFPAKKAIENSGLFSKLECANFFAASSYGPNLPESVLVSD
ncbi:hypothetical protein NBZ79_03570 [Sneathiella marina]|uniref:Uncharacterized protein n=1 Tax=Sneathiella marina TaxID=2950108 RepID=A0ABY4W4D9_9PROT|nr:hypothetical protein [Sneathiella marina]USG62053.1 hypothetical protein NBZ79_03570 [Sneathiella marina]